MERIIYPDMKTSFSIRVKSFPISQASRFGAIVFFPKGMTLGGMSSGTYIPAAKRTMHGPISGIIRHSRCVRINFIL